MIRSLHSENFDLKFEMDYLFWNLESLHFEIPNSTFKSLNSIPNSQIFIFANSKISWSHQKIKDYFSGNSLNRKSFCIFLIAIFCF